MIKYNFHYVVIPLMTSHILKYVDFTKTIKSCYLNNESLFFLQIKKLITHQELMIIHGNKGECISHVICHRKGCEISKVTFLVTISIKVEHNKFYTLVATLSQGNDFGLFFISSCFSGDPWGKHFILFSEIARWVRAWQI